MHNGMNSIKKTEENVLVSTLYVMVPPWHSKILTKLCCFPKSVALGIRNLFISLYFKDIIFYI